MKVKGKSEQINNNVWKVERNGHHFSVKRYDSSAIALKVNELHKALHALSFPHIVPVVPSEHQLLFMQPWLKNAKPVNFKKRADRTVSLEALMTLHETASQIDWPATSYLHQYPLLAKWEDRLFRFRAIREACEVYIGKNQVDDILLYATNALRIVRRTYQDHADNTLLHGDVVHHNILRDHKGVIRFIDFDLACIGPAGTEIALWMHRVLPQIDYDLEYLMNEQPSLQKLNESSLALLLYPNELLREWLHFFSLSKVAQERHIKNMIPFTESALSHWPKLWYNVERIKN